MKRMIFLVLCLYGSAAYAQSVSIEKRIELLTKKKAYKEGQGKGHSKLDKKIKRLTDKEPMIKVRPQNPVVHLSLGGFVSMDNSLQNEKYQWQQVVAPGSTGSVTLGSPYQLKQSGNSEQPIGPNAMGSLIWQTGRSAFGIGPSVGFGFTVQGVPHLTYLAGGSIHYYGFIATAGIAGMFVSTLSDNQQTVVSSSTYFTNPPGVQYNKELKTGLFISISYSILSN